MDRSSSMRSRRSPALCLASLAVAALCCCAAARQPHQQSLPHSEHRRSLLQTQVEEIVYPVYTPLSDGGLELANSSVITLGSGTPTPQLQPLLDVALNGLYNSDSIRGAGCLSLAANALTGYVSVAVVTEASLSAAASGGQGLDTSQLVYVPGSTVTSTDIVGTVPLTPSTLYVLLIIGPDDVYVDEFIPVQLAYAAHPEGSATCQAAAAAATAPAPGIAGLTYAPTASTPVSYPTSFLTAMTLPYGVDTVLGGFMGATCVGFEMLQEVRTSDLGSYGGVVDLSVFLLSAPQFVAFQNSNGATFSTMSGICRQNSANLGACTSIASGLDPTQQYLLIGVAGLYTNLTNASSVVYPLGVRYAAQASGSCSLSFPALTPSPGIAPSTAPSAGGPVSIPQQALAPAPTATVRATPAVATPTGTVTAASPSPAATSTPAVTAGATPTSSGSSGVIGGFTTGR